MLHGLIDRRKQNRLFCEMKDHPPAGQARNNFVVLRPALRHDPRPAKPRGNNHTQRNSQPSPPERINRVDAPIAHNKGTVAQSGGQVMRFVPALDSGKIDG